MKNIQNICSGVVSATVCSSQGKAVDRMNRWPVFGSVSVSTPVHTCVSACLTAVCSRWDEDEDLHGVSGDSATLPASVCVHAGCRDNNRIRWITAIQPSYTGGHHSASEKNTQSFIQTSNPYFIRQDEREGNLLSAAVARGRCCRRQRGCKYTQSHSTVLMFSSTSMSKTLYTQTNCTEGRDVQPVTLVFHQYVTHLMMDFCQSVLHIVFCL